jgi:hypothetical protein
LAIGERTYGADSPNVATDLNNLGRVLRDQRDLAAAREHRERAVTLTATTLGVTHLDYALALGNLALVLADEGDVAGARRHLTHARDIMRAAMGDSFEGTLAMEARLAALPTA